MRHSLVVVPPRVLVVGHGVHPVPHDGEPLLGGAHLKQRGGRLEDRVEVLGPHLEKKIQNSYKM